MRRTRGLCWLRVQGFRMCVEAAWAKQQGGQTPTKEQLAVQPYILKGPQYIPYNPHITPI